MVDWDRVDELRAKGWGWDRIADDEDVGFHPEASVTEPGRALRALYHRQRRKSATREVVEVRAKKEDREAEERRWTFARVGMFATPIVGIWAALAYVAPSPVGILVPAIPYLGLAAAAAAIILIYGLLRTPGHRWTPVLKSTLVGAIVLGFVVSGIIGLTGYLAFGCPYLPPASALTTQPQGWASSTSITPWKDNGMPVFYFYGATWCPYCSASSWAMWKALTEFQSGFDGSTSGIPGTQFYYSNPNDVYPNTPEVILSGASVTSSVVSFQVSEYYWTQTNGATAGTFPGTSNCVQQAYVTAYSASSIPFVVINGQYVHGGASLINPNDLSTWAGSGAGTVAEQVLQEDSSTGSAWLVEETQAALICAFVLKSDGYSSVSAFLAAYPGLHNPSNYQWTSGMQTLVNQQLSAIV